MNIIIGVTGSIAAYKAHELIRLFVKNDHDVRVVLTEGGGAFVSPLSLQALSGNRVLDSFWDDGSVDCMEHIRWGDWADVIVVAPASANFIARYSHGMADTPLLALLLASTAPVVVAPAMNVNMWNHEQTRENVDRLKRRGVLIVEPEEGELACGWQGQGRLASLDLIYSRVNECVKDIGDLNGRKIIVTGGPTVEQIDAVRYITNKSSGKMAISLVNELVKRGADVVFIHGPIQLAPDRAFRMGSVRCIEVSSALQMYESLRTELFANNNAEKVDMVIMAAAVADVRPLKQQLHKIKKGDLPDTISLTRNPDIIREIGLEISKNEYHRPILVGFALETEGGASLVSEMRRKKQEKGINCIIGNLAEDAIGSDHNRICLLGSEDEVINVPANTKKELAVTIIDYLIKFL
jgi:phosphopantothenoylcysteine decarboxylase/phosphopantothenate--cysteine ligase